MKHIDTMPLVAEIRDGFVYAGYEGRAPDYRLHYWGIYRNSDGKNIVATLSSDTPPAHRTYMEPNT